MTTKEQAIHKAFEDYTKTWLIIGAISMAVVCMLH